MNGKSRFRLLPIYRGLLLIALVPNCYATSQNFLIAPNGSLPTSVTEGSSVLANFTLTNLTSTRRNGYRIQGFPTTVTQVTGGNNCSSPINLPAHASCNLQFNITGAVNSGFAVCKGNSCTTSPVPLNVTLSDAPSNLLASGTYNTPDLTFFPLLVQNKGSVLSYPSSIITNLPTNPAYTAPDLYSVSCSGDTCIAVGNDDNGNINPLAALSLDGGNTWTYPIGSVGTWPSDFNVNSAGIFSSASCSPNLCLASGTYTDNNTAFPHPFLAQYKNSTWTYPITAQNPPPGFDIYGAFNGVSCHNATCIAVGTYQNISSQPFPLIAETTDSGSTWNYVVDNTSTLPSNYQGRGTFLGASCFDGICIAGGTYEDSTQLSNFPLLAQSLNGGQWNYVIDDTVGPQFPGSATPFSLTQFNSVSCSATICIAAGTYLNNSTNQFGLLAQSTNGGSQWNYAISTLAQQPSDYLANAQFTSVSCDENFCIAAGSYTNQNSNQLAMLAQTTDGGNTWSYAIDGTHGSEPPDYTSSAQFNTTSCHNHVCMAAGSYMVGQATYPMYVQSTNGVSWTYIVSDNVATLPSDFNNFGIFKGSSVGSVSLADYMKKNYQKKHYFFDKGKKQK